MPALLASLFRQSVFRKYLRILPILLLFSFLENIILVKTPVSNLVDAVRLLYLNKCNYVLVSVVHIFFTFM
jgi:hypothetical protein